MKWLLASDIHGSAYWCRKLTARYRAEKADRMLLLGDLLYHGPRNDLPEEYNPREVISMLNGMKNDILAVRGNCEAEVDQMVLDFPVLADYAVLDLGCRMIFATHGHVYNEDHLPPLHRGDILLHGHTHIPKCTVHDTYICMNPGSVSIPKENTHHGYMTLDGGVFRWHDLDGNVVDEYGVPNGEI